MVKFKKCKKSQFLNRKTKRCNKKCKKSQVKDRTSKKCKSKCKKSQKRSRKTKRCVKKKSVQRSRSKGKSFYKKRKPSRRRRRRKTTQKRKRSRKKKLDPIKLEDFTLITLNANGEQVKPSEARVTVEIFENPKQSNTSLSYDNWKFMASRIQMSNMTICQKQISKGYLSTIQSKSKTILLLNKMGKGRNRVIKTLIGFAILNEINKDEIYIKVICANLKNSRDVAPLGEDSTNLKSHKIRSGAIILKQIENYARKHNYKFIKLEALTYVINYYRKFGYKHITPENTEEAPELRKKAIIASEKYRFKSDQDAAKTIREDRKNRDDSGFTGFINELLKEGFCGGKKRKGNLHKKGSRLPGCFHEGFIMRKHLT